MCVRGMQLTISHKVLEERSEKLKRDKEAVEKQWTSDTRLLSNRGQEPPDLPESDPDVTESAVRT